MKNILCVGSVTADVIVKPAEHIPAPGTLEVVDLITAQVGGCAVNSAIDLAKLGLPSAISCKIGCDSFGELVEKSLTSAGVNTDGVIRDPSISTTASVVFSRSDGERSFLHSRASASHFTDSDVSDELIEKNDVVFIAGTGLMPMLDGEPVARLLKRAREMGKFTAMDTGWDFENIWGSKVLPSLPYLDLFMPSYDEATRVSGLKDPKDIAMSFRFAGARNVIIKLGGDGALFLPENGDFFTLPTYRSIKPVDTTGAGDSFCAGILAGLALGKDLRESGRIANAVGTHCIMKVGATTGIPAITDIYEFMSAHAHEVE